MTASLLQDGGVVFIGHAIVHYPSLTGCHDRGGTFLLTLEWLFTGGDRYVGQFGSLGLQVVNE